MSEECNGNYRDCDLKCVKKHDLKTLSRIKMSEETIGQNTIDVFKWEVRQVYEHVHRGGYNEMRKYEEGLRQYFAFNGMAYDSVKRDSLYRELTRVRDWLKVHKPKNKIVTNQIKQKL